MLKWSGINILSYLNKLFCRVWMVYCAWRSDQPIPRLRVRTIIRGVLWEVFGTISKVGGRNSMDWSSLSVFLANSWYITISFTSVELIARISHENCVTEAGSKQPSTHFHWNIDDCTQFYVFTSGPIAGILADKYGCRLIGMIGGIFMCAGCVISSFATSVPYLYLSYGVITGTLHTLYRLNTLSDSPVYRLVFSFDLSRYLSKFTEGQYVELQDQDHSFQIKVESHRGS